MNGLSLKKYRQWCGRRSFIFQVILLAWTILMLIVIMPSLEPLSNRELRERDVNPYNPHEVSAYRFSTLGCPLGLWFIIAFPLGIAAIATLSRTKSG